MSELEIHNVTGTGVYVAGDDIDTDRIIPAHFMKCVTFDGLGQYAFYGERYNEDGYTKNHPIDDPRFAGASMLISGRNFGCGSSREHAPQALYRHGFRGIIAQSFAEIFFGNCTTLGIPCATVTAETMSELAQLVEAEPATSISIDVDALKIRAGERAFDFEMAKSAQQALVSGRWDPLQELLSRADRVGAAAASLPYVGWN